MDNEQKQRLTKSLLKTADDARRQLYAHERLCKQCRPQGGVRLASSMCQTGQSLWKLYAQFTDGPIVIVEHKPALETCAECGADHIPGRHLPKDV